MADQDLKKFLYRADPDAVWKETVRNEIKAVMKWEEEWGFQVDSYRQCQQDAAAANMFKEDSETEGSKRLPKYPCTTAKHIGWLSGRPEFNHERFGFYGRPLTTLYKAFDWPVESCP